MPSTLGSDLSNLPTRYAVSYEAITKTWRIIDVKHPELSKVPNINLMEMDTDIPDDHPAVTVINETMFWLLVSEAIKEGVLNQSVAGVSGEGRRNSDSVLAEDFNKVIDELAREKLENERLVKELSDTKDKFQGLQGSEEFRLKKDIIQSLTRLALAEDINETRRIP